MSIFDLQNVAGPGQGYRFASFAVAPRAEIRSHAHDGWHVLALASGELEEEAGNGAARMDPSVVRLSRPGAAHAIDFGALGARCLVLHVEDEGLARRLAAGVAAGAASVFIESPALALRLAEAARAAARLETSPLGDIALRRAVAELVRLCEDPEAPPAPGWLDAALAEMLETAGSVDAAARRNGRSREHFARACLRHFGLSPRDIRRRAALSRALHLVASDGASLADAALAAGFFDQSHFSHAVRALLYMTPGEAARRLRG